MKILPTARRATGPIVTKVPMSPRLVGRVPAILKAHAYSTFDVKDIPIPEGVSGPITIVEGSKYKMRQTVPTRYIDEGGA